MQRVNEEQQQQQQTHKKYENKLYEHRHENGLEKSHTHTHEHKHFRLHVKLMLQTRYGHFGLDAVLHARTRTYIHTPNAFTVQPCTYLGGSYTI